MRSATSITFNVNHSTVQGLQEGQYFMWGSQLFMKIAKSDKFTEFISLKDDICILAVDVEKGDIHPFFPEETITPAQVEISVSNFN
jgi:hypothetical protein